MTRGSRESMLPRPAEIAVAVLLIAFLVGTLVMPTVEVEPYHDVLADESPDRLRARLANPDINPIHAQRCLTYLAEAEGEAAAVREALHVLRLPRTTSPEIFRDYVATHPVAAAAGDVLNAWHAGIIPDRVWRRDMVDVWAPHCVWVAVPLTASLAYDDNRNRWVLDVLARGNDQRYAVPGGLANDPLSRKPAWHVFVTHVINWFDSLPAHDFQQQTQERIFVNLPLVPADVLADKTLRTALAECLSSVATDRRTPPSPSDAEAEDYARQILALVREYLFPAELPPPPDETPEARAARLESMRLARQTATENWRGLLTYIINSASGEPDAWARVCKALMDQN